LWPSFGPAPTVPCPSCAEGSRAERSTPGEVSPEQSRGAESPLSRFTSIKPCYFGPWPHQDTGAAAIPGSAGLEPTSGVQPAHLQPFHTSCVLQPTQLFSPGVGSDSSLIPPALAFLTSGYRALLVFSQRTY